MSTDPRVDDVSTDPAGAGRPVERAGLRTARTLLAISGCGVLLAAVGYAAMFSSFSHYDDEGFLIVAMRSYLEGEALYDDVFAQYGPLYYHLVGGLYRLFGAAPAHDTGRLLALGLWVASSGVLGLAVARLTSRLSVGLAVQIGVFAVLSWGRFDPMSAGFLAVVLIIALVAVSALLAPSRPKAGLAAVGVLVAAVALVKPNVGGFALLSVGFAFLAVCRPFRGRGTMRAVAGAALVAAPFILMASGLSAQPVLAFASVVALSALAVVTVTLREPPQPVFAVRDAGWLLAGTAGTLLLVVAITLLQGTTLRGLVRGLVLDPLRQPDIYALPLPFSAEHVVVAGLSLAVALLAVTPRVLRMLPPVAIGLARVGAGLAMAGLLISGLGGAYSVQLQISLAWIAHDPGSPRRLAFPSVLLPALAVLQALHAYPVAGSQTAWAGFLLIPLAGLAVHRGAREVVAALPRRDPVRPGAWPSRAAAPLLLAVVLVASLGVLVRPVSAYREGTPLDLPGARRLRLPAEQVGWLRGVTADLDATCTTFVSMPGLNSFFVFAGQDPPSDLNISGWIVVFDEDLQRRIVSEVSPTPGLCAVRSAPATDFWLRGRPLPQRPLVRFIQDGFEPFTRRGPYEVLVRADEG